MTVSRGIRFSATLPAMARISTRNLELAPANDELSGANWRDHRELARLLSARIPESWPPELVKDESSPDGEGWWDWYVIKRDENIVIGMVGLKGWPSVSRTLQVGCSFLPEYAQQGFGTESVEGITAWALSQPGIETVTAATPLGNAGAIRVLRKLGFADIPSDDPAYLRFAKRR